MADLSTSYLGLRLRNPILAASSGLTRNVDGVRRCADAGAGAVVLKSIFEEEIEAEVSELKAVSPRVAWYEEADEYLSRYGRENAVSSYLELIREAKRAVSIPIIASINCVTAGGWTDFATKVAHAGADAIELNVFVLPSDPRRDAKANEKVYFDVAREVTRRVSIPVALKVGPYFSALSQTLISLSQTGIRGLVLFNRFFRIDFDIDRVELTSGSILSTPDEIVIPLRWISILSRRVGCDLAATTGIHDGTGVIKQLLAGAAAVQVCSALYRNRIEHLGAMLADVEAWMDRHGHSSIEEFRGRLSQSGSDNPAAYERVQFLEATSGNAGDV